MAASHTTYYVKRGTMPERSCWVWEVAYTTSECVNSTHLQKHHTAPGCKEDLSSGCHTLHYHSDPMIQSVRGKQGCLTETLARANRRETAQSSRISEQLQSMSSSTDVILLSRNSSYLLLGLSRLNVYHRPSRPCSLSVPQQSGLTRSALRLAVCSRRPSCCGNGTWRSECTHVQKVNCVNRWLFQRTPAAWHQVFFVTSD